MREQTVKGPAALLPDSVVDQILHVRNTESLHRLALMAEGSTKHPSQTD
jgi:hypothetical protein